MRGEERSRGRGVKRKRGEEEYMGVGGEEVGTKK